MARATWVQTNFNGGEWSPLTYGRFDIAKYKTGLADCTNYLPMQQGGLTRRPGTRFVAATKDTGYAVRLQKFEFSLSQSYILEFGNLYVRFYTNDGQLQTSGVAAYDGGTTYAPGDLVTNGGVTYYCIAATTGNAPPNTTYWYAQSGTIYEVPTPYTSDDIWKLGFTQKADVIYITNPTTPVYKLQRKGATNWQLAEVVFLDGPYGPLNLTTTTLEAGNSVGTSTVLASSTFGINDGAGFQATDVGRLLRIRCGDVWVWGTISAYIDSKHVSWTVSVYQGPGSPSQATATAVISGGAVTAINVTSGGSGYTDEPNTATVSIVNPNSDPATGTMVLGTGTGTGGADTGDDPGDPTHKGGPLRAQGVIKSVSVTHQGSGYVTAPQIVVNSATGSGAQLVANITGGAVTSVTIVNGGSSYTAQDTLSFVGGAAGGSGATALVSVANGSVIGIVLLSGGTGYTVAPTVVISPPQGASSGPTRFWNLGLWSSVNGYPQASTFYQDRLCFGGASNYPGRVDGSNTSDYENMAPTNADGTVVDSHAISFTLSANALNLVQWITSDENGLLVGTSGNEWLVSPSTTQQALTPTNVNTRLMSNYGSAFVAPIRFGKSNLFIQRTQRKLRELFFQFYGNTFMSQDISLIGEHLTTSGVKQMAAQLAPQQVIWFVLNNGRLTAATYDKDQEVNGWHKHYLGGFSDAAQTSPPTVDSVAVISTPSTQRDEVWVAVKRYINGATFRSVEVMTKLWEDGDDVTYAVQGLDCSAQYNGSPTTTVTGLTWLKGQTVGVLADGSVHADVVVDNSGAITLTRSASVVQVGLKYTSKGKTLNIEAGGADGPSQGKLKRIIRTVFRFFQSMGLSLSSDDPNVPGGYEDEPWRTSADPMDSVTLFSGDKRWSSDTDWTVDGCIAFEQSDPLPSNITMLMAQLDTEDNL